MFLMLFIATVHICYKKSPPIFTNQTPLNEEAMKSITTSPAPPIRSRRRRTADAPRAGRPHHVTSSAPTTAAPVRHHRMRIQNSNSLPPPPPTLLTFCHGRPCPRPRPTHSSRLPLLNVSKEDSEPERSSGSITNTTRCRRCSPHQISSSSERASPPRWFGCACVAHPTARPASYRLFASDRDCAEWLLAGRRGGGRTDKKAKALSHPC